MKVLALNSSPRKEGQSKTELEPVLLEDGDRASHPPRAKHPMPAGLKMRV